MHVPEAEDDQDGDEVADETRDEYHRIHRAERHQPVQWQRPARTMQTLDVLHKVGSGVGLHNARAQGFNWIAGTRCVCVCAYSLNQHNAACHLPSSDILHQPSIQSTPFSLFCWFFPHPVGWIVYENLNKTENQIKAASRKFEQLTMRLVRIARFNLSCCRKMKQTKHSAG